MSGTEIIAGTARLTALLVSPPIDELAVIVDRIRARIRRTTTDIIATGNDLLTVKAKLEHGEFLTWIDREFQMTDRTARNFMQAAKWAADKSEMVSVLPPATIYKLASPSTPETIKAEVVADLKAARVVDHRAVERRIKIERDERTRIAREQDAEPAPRPTSSAPKLRKIELKTTTTYDDDILYDAAGVSEEARLRYREQAAVDGATEAMVFLERDLSPYALTLIGTLLQHEDVWRALKDMLAKRLAGGSRRALDETAS
jgi:hypothetical protein